jgi:Fe-S-cluster containining protein
MNDTTIREKKSKLYELYDAFAESARPFTGMAVCKVGCADCCTSVGDVGATTLEGFLILEHIRTRFSAGQKELSKRLKQNRKDREVSKLARCAFLQKDNTCAVYQFRPFSCRRLYSLKQCGESGPMVHRQVWDLAREIEASIQAVDDTGYSGHLSHILQILSDAGFLKTYLEGGFSPDDISEYALKHNIIINRFVKH